MLLPWPCARADESAPSSAQAFPGSQRPRLRGADPDVSELLALVLRAGAPKSSTGSQLCASGDLRCEIKRCSLLSVLSYDYSLRFFLGKEVCDGAEHQERAGEANHRPPAAAAHQPAGERPPEMLLVSRALPRRVEFFAHSEPEHSPGLPAASYICVFPR